MNKSDEIGALASALSKLQGEITDVQKEKSGYGYKYADLSQILEVARPVLSKHGLAVTQLCGSAHDKVTVETVLMHASGQWISSMIEMGVERGKGMSLAQAVGSVVSYARRYAFASVLGIAQTDNDGHAEQAIPIRPISRPEPVRHLAEDGADVYGEFEALVKKAGKTDESINKWCAKEGAENIHQIPKDKMVKVVEKLRQEVKQ